MTTQIAARAYTLAEIDEMRELVAELNRPFGQRRLPNDTIEDRLRTYMMGGVGVEELKAEVDAQAAKYREAYEARQERMRDLTKAMELPRTEDPAPASLEERRAALNAALAKRKANS